MGLPNCPGNGVQGVKSRLCAGGSHERPERSSRPTNRGRGAGDVCPRSSGNRLGRSWETPSKGEGPGHKQRGSELEISREDPEGRSV